MGKPVSRCSFIIVLGIGLGALESATVAREYMEHDARLMIGVSPTRASQNMLPGCEGAPKWTM